MADSAPSEEKDQLTKIADDITGWAKKRGVPIALQVLEQTMLNGKQDNVKVNACNSVLDRFGHPAKGTGPQVVAFPIPLEYMKGMIQGLAKGFQGEEDAIDAEVVPSTPSAPLGLPSNGSGASKPQ